MDEERDLFGLFDNAKVSSLDELSEDVSEEIKIDTTTNGDEELYSYDDEYYSEEDEEEEDEQTDADEVELGDFIDVGDIFTFGDDEEEDFSIDMECVFKTYYEGNMYVLFHPKEAPEQSQFVPMCIELDEEEDMDENIQVEQILVPVTVEEIAEQIVEMYKSELMN